MKFSKWILGAALLFSTQAASVQGKNACDPCDPCAVKNPCDLCEIDFCDLKYDFYVDALYWEVCKGDLNVGRNHHDHQEYLSPEFSWGYRLGGAASWRNWDLGFRWTSLNNKTSSEYAYLRHERAKFHFNYRVLDVELGYTCCMDCGPFSFRPFVGGKFAWIKDHFDKESGGEANSRIKNKSEGLYIGSSAKWELCKYTTCDRTIPISLVARASAGVLRSKFTQEVEDGNGDIDKEHIYMPYNDVYVGLDFAFCDMCGWDAFFQVGYEAQHFGWRQYNHREHTTDLGLGGLVLRFGADF